MPLAIDSGRAWLGVDPGASGACVLLTANGSRDSLRLAKATDADVWKWLAETTRLWETFCCIEKVGGYISGSAFPGSAMFNFGKVTGKLLGFLTAAAIPFEEVTPQTWQKALGITPRRKKSKKQAGESGTEWKRRLRQKAEAIFPHVEMTNDVADALLLAEYCRRVRSDGGAEVGRGPLGSGRSAGTGGAISGLESYLPARLLFRRQ